MSTLDKVIEKFGDKCKWLTCDPSCHYNECHLRMAERRVLEEKFESLKFSYPWLAYYFSGSVGCDYCGMTYEKRNENEEDEIVEDDEGFSYTTFEKQAEEIMGKKYSDESTIIEAYRKSKENYIKTRKDEIEKNLKMIEEMENDKV